MPYVDLPGILLAQDAAVMATAYGLDYAQLQKAISTVPKLFGVNQTCLAACGLAPTPSTSTAG